MTQALPCELPTAGGHDGPLVLAQGGRHVGSARKDVHACEVREFSGRKPSHFLVGVEVGGELPNRFDAATAVCAIDQAFITYAMTLGPALPCPLDHGAGIHEDPVEIEQDRVALQDVRHRGTTRVRVQSLGANAGEELRDLRLVQENQSKPLVADSLAQRIRVLGNAVLDVPVEAIEADGGVGSQHINEFCQV